MAAFIGISAPPMDGGTLDDVLVGGTLTINGTISTGDTATINLISNIPNAQPVVVTAAFQPTGPNTYQAIFNNINPANFPGTSILSAQVNPNGCLVFIRVHFGSFAVNTKKKRNKIKRKLHELIDKL